MLLLNRSFNRVLPISSYNACHTLNFVIRQSKNESSTQGTGPHIRKRPRLKRRFSQKRRLRLVVGFALVSNETCYVSVPWSRDAELLHFGNETRSRQSQSCRGAIGSADHPGVTL